jgi:hypothetical protein
MWERVPHVGENAGRDMPEHTGTLRVTIREAAARLGVTEGAIRKRLQGGSLPKEQGEDGTVYVYLPVSHDASHDASHGASHEQSRTETRHSRHSPDPRDELVAQLRAEVEAWREEARRKDHLLAAALERIPPQLEPPAAPPRASETATPQPGRVELPRDQQRPSERPWWRRMFGG